MFLPTLIAQFGNGLQPPSQAYAPEELTRDGFLGSFDLIISNILGLLTIVGGLIFVIYFLMAAIEWITAGGDSGKISSARDKIVQGVIGLIILVASYAILGLIGSIVGLDLIDPVAQIKKIIPGEL